MPVPDSFDLTVVVVSYNVRPFLDHCLQSVYRAAGDLSLQVIVVDNASQDGSADMTARRYPGALLIRNRENLGFGRANNQAFVQAAGEAVLILNPDAFVQEDTLRVLLNRLRQSPYLGAVGPMILLPDGRFEPRSMRGFPTPWPAFTYFSGLAALFPASPRFSRYLLTYLDPTREHEVDALTGCCMMVRRGLLEKLGGFDSDYFMYGEDLDLCWRIHKAGYRILYSPEARILHFKGESTRRCLKDAGRHHQQAMRLFVDKNLAGSLSRPIRTAISLGFRFRAAQRRINTLSRRRAGRSAAAENNESLSHLPRFTDLAELESRIANGSLKEALINGSDVSYSRLIALIRNLRSRAVEFTLFPLENAGEEAPGLRVEVLAKRG